MAQGLPGAAGRAKGLILDFQTVARAEEALRIRKNPQVTHKSATSPQLAAAWAGGGATWSVLGGSSHRRITGEGLV